MRYPALTWAYKRRGFYPKGLIAAIKTVLKRAIGAHVDRESYELRAQAGRSLCYVFGQGTLLSPFPVLFRGEDSHLKEDVVPFQGKKSGFGISWDGQPQKFHSGPI